jgi:hypothetical protein
LLKKPTIRQANAERSPLLRSRLSNRPGRLPGVDGRSERARRFRDLTSGLESDIGRELNSAEKSLVDQAAALMIQRETMTAAGAHGERIESKELVRISGALVRTLAALGLTQRPEPSTAALKEPHNQHSHDANDSATLSSSERVRRVQQLLERAKHSKDPDLLLRAARVREILAIAQRRAKARKSSIDPSGAETGCAAASRDGSRDETILPSH